MTETDEDYAQYLIDLVRIDWVDLGASNLELHALTAYDVDVTNWRYENATTACGKATDLAFVPGIFSRMGLQRCATCCDVTGLPRGKGSPKNDPECRPLVGLDHG